MDKKLSPKKRSLKRSGSDSGISNDSMDCQVTRNSSVNQNQTVMAKPAIFRITVGADRKRVVNGNELVVPSVPPRPLSPKTKAFEDITSSESENDFDDTDSSVSDVDSDDSEDYEDGSECTHDDLTGGMDAPEGINRSEDMQSNQNSPQFSPSPESCESFDDNLEGEIYWERDSIDVSVITSKCSCFEGAVLLKEYVTKLYLPGYEPVVKTPVPMSNLPFIPYAPKPMDDDMLSLHPNDNFRTDLNKNVLAPPVVKKMRLNVLTPQAASQPRTSFKPPLNFTPPCNKAPNNLQSKHKSPVTNVTKTPLPSSSCHSAYTPNTTQESPIKLEPIRNPHAVNNVREIKQRQIYNNPPPLMVPSTMEPPVMIPPTVGRGKISLFKLPNMICKEFEHCTQRNTCRALHKFESNMFLSSVASQETFWDYMKLKFYPINTDVIKAMLQHFPPALAMTNNRTLLMQMITDTLGFEGLLDRTQPITEIINALLQIKNTPLKFDAIVEEILQTNKCYQPNHGPTQKTLCDIILSIAIEQPNFLQFWPLFEKMFSFIEYQVDHVVVDRIVKACVEEEASPSVLDGVLYKLLRTKLVDQAQLSPMLLLQFVEVQRSQIAAESPASTERSFNQIASPNEAEKQLGELFEECANAEKLSDFFQGHSQLEYSEQLIKIITNILSKEYAKSKNVCAHIIYFRDSVVECMLGEVDNDLRTLLMTITFHILVFQREHPNGNSFHEISAKLIGLFEETLNEFHTIPVYNRDYEDGYQKSVFIFSRLIHGKCYHLALRWMRTEKFAIPPVTLTQTYNWFYPNMRQLFDGLYRYPALDECKNLILLLKDLGFDVDGKHKTEKNEVWNMFDYYKRFVKTKIEGWQNNERDIMIDANESIFQLYKHLELFDLRSILILLYQKSNGCVLPKLSDIVDFCADFYQQNDECIFYNAHLSITEIQLITHIYFYKMLKRNQRPRAVPTKYEELCNGEKINAPRVKTAGVWDTEKSLKRRVNYAMNKFAPRGIQKFDGVFPDETVKYILEQIRRRVPPT